MSVSLRSFSQTTPERRSGTRVLSAIPSKTYNHIFGFIQPTEETSPYECKVVYSNLACVCRLFASIALPLIHNSWVINGRSYNQDSSQQAFDRLCKSLAPQEDTEMTQMQTLGQSDDDAQTVALHTELAEQVHKCRLRYYWPVGTAPLQTLCMYLTAMKKMPNLERLTLYNIHISQPVVIALRELRAYRVSIATPLCLGLEYCKYDQDLVSDEEAQQTFADICRPMLQTYMGGHGMVQVFLRDALSVTPPVNHWNPAPLRELFLEFVNDDLQRLLPAFLEATPSLTSLGLGTVQFTPTLPVFAVDSSALPNLHILQCPAPVLSSFAFCLPTLAILCIRGFVADGTRRMLELPDNLQELLLAATRLTKFTTSYKHIKSKDLVMENLFPALEIFSFDMPEDLHDNDRIRQHVYLQLPKSRHVREIHLRGNSTRFTLDLVAQHETVRYLAQQYPALHKCAFTDFITWTRIPESDAWRPFTPHAKKQDLLPQLRERPSRWTDFNGCFAALLNSSK